MLFHPLLKKIYVLVFWITGIMYFGGLVFPKNEIVYTQNEINLPKLHPVKVPLIEDDNQCLNLDKKKEKPIQKPKSKSWKILRSLKCPISFDEEIDDLVFKPLPNRKIKSLEGKIITLDGYFYPLIFFSKSINDSSLVGLSYTPYSYCSCSSCNSLQIESTLHVHLDKVYKYEPNKLHTFKGRLKINKKNQDLSTVPYELMEASCTTCEVE